MPKFYTSEYVRRMPIYYIGTGVHERPPERSVRVRRLIAPVSPQ
jgi:hypothetical protein